MRVEDLIKILKEYDSDAHVEIMVADPEDDPNFFMFTEIDPDIYTLDHYEQPAVIINCVLKNTPPTYIEALH